MKDIIDSILLNWRITNDCELETISNIEIKSAEPELGIYTLYFYINKTIVRIKALKQNTDWKIINLT